MKVTVTSDWLDKHRASKNLAILDARSRAAYKKSHIRGAIHADLFHYFVPGTDYQGLRSFQKDLARKLGRMGLTGKETIVVYESAFGMRAARVAWMLEYAGAHRVFLLEGGFRRWRESHLPVERRIPRRGLEIFQIKPAPQLLATAGEVRSNRLARILDVRSKVEFNGTEGRECDTRLGRIPRSTWLEWTNFIKEGRTFKPITEMADDLKKRGVTKNRTVFTYCHRGARAAAAFYALRSLGFNDVRNYIGSWHEWSARKNLPIIP